MGLGEKAHKLISCLSHDWRVRQVKLAKVKREQALGTTSCHMFSI